MATARVFQGNNHVANFVRTSTGLRLEFLADAELKNGFLSTHLPVSDWEGPDLPPFFLNLLPEGARLKLLLERSANRDDSLGLLLKVGWDTVGDVAVVTDDHNFAMPEPLLKESDIESADFWELFYNGVTAPFDGAIPGVQEKISASTIAFGVRAAKKPSAILKLNPTRFPRLVQNEAFFLNVARKCGLAVNPHRLVQDVKGEYGLLVERFDRTKPNGKVHKLHQEDGCQLLNQIPANKYDIPFRAIADAMFEHSTSKVIDIERLIRLVAFSYAIGNGDLHAKNVSMIWDEVVTLTPAYDLLSTLAYPDLDTKMALKFEGKDDNLRMTDFLQFGLRYGVKESVIRKTVLQVADGVEGALPDIDQIGFDTKTTLRLTREIQDRVGRLRR